MSQPTPYDRQLSFALFSSENPGTPHSGTDLDAEFNAVKISLDETQANLSKIQDDDGSLKRNSVGRAQLDTTFTLGFKAPTAWAPSTFYDADLSTVFYNSKFYTALVTHTSGDTFDASNWNEVADFSGAVSIEDNSIDAGDKLIDESIPTAKYAPQSVTESVLGTNSVSTAKLQNNSVTPAKASSAADWAALIIPAGKLDFHSSPLAPTGWVNVTNGATLSRATYPALWLHAQAAIAAGSQWFTAGDGSTTFTVVNPRGRALFVADAAAAVISGATVGGATFGAKEKVLTQANLPAIKPALTVTDPGHPHNYIDVFANSNDPTGGIGAVEDAGGVPNTYTHPISKTTDPATTGISVAFTNNLGSGEAVPTLPPGIAAYLIMKAH